MRCTARELHHAVPTFGKGFVQREAKPLRTAGEYCETHDVAAVLRYAAELSGRLFAGGPLGPCRNLLCCLRQGRQPQRLPASSRGRGRRLGDLRIQKDQIRSLGNPLQIPAAHPFPEVRALVSLAHFVRRPAHEQFFLVRWLCVRRQLRSLDLVQHADGKHRIAMSKAGSEKSLLAKSDGLAARATLQRIRWCPRAVTCSRLASTSKLSLARPAALSLCQRP